MKILAVAALLCLTACGNNAANDMGGSGDLTGGARDLAGARDDGQMSGGDMASQLTDMAGSSADLSLLCKGMWKDVMVCGGATNASGFCGAGMTPTAGRDCAGVEKDAAAAMWTAKLIQGCAPGCAPSANYADWKAVCCEPI